MSDNGVLQSSHGGFLELGRLVEKERESDRTNREGEENGFI